MYLVNNVWFHVCCLEEVEFVPNKRVFINFTTTDIPFHAITGIECEQPDLTAN